MGIQSNIWKLKADRFLANSWLFAPILVTYYESNGLAASEIYLVQAVFATLLAAIEIPTGYFSDVVGRKFALVIGALLIPSGIAIYALAHGFWGFVAAEVCLAIGLSLRSGTDTALLYDTLVEIKQEKEHKRIEGSAFFAQQLGTAAGNIIGGLISVVSLRLTFYINIATSLFLLPLSLSMTEPKRESRQTQSTKAHASDLIKAIKYCAQHRTLRNATLYLALITGVNIMGYWSYYLFYSKIGLPIAAFGFIASACSLIGGFGGKLTHIIERKWGENVAYCLPLLTAPSYILIGWIDSVASLPFVFLNSLLWGLALPLLRDTLHKNARTNIRATLLSIASMGGRLLYVVLALVIGKLIDATSLELGLMALGTTFLIGGIIPVWGLLHAKQN